MGSFTRNVRNLEVAPVAWKVVRGTEGRTATLIRSVVEGSRYQSNKIRFVRAGRRPTVKRESREC
jgi:hypothetical protein